MLLPLYVAFTAVCLITGFARIRRPIPAACAVVFLVVLSMGIYGEYDLINYTRHFDAITGWDVVFAQDEWLFWALGYIVKVLGGDIYAFKLIVLLITGTLVWLGLREYCWNWNLLMGFFMCFEAFRSTIQWNFFLAEAIFIFALRFLTPGHRRPTVYVALILAGSFVHSSLALALLFSLVNLRSKRLLVGCVVAASLLFLAVAVAYPGQLGMLISSLGGERLEQYTTARGSGWVLCVWLFAVTVLVSKYLEARISLIGQDSILSGYAITVHLVVLVAVCALPLCVVSIEFYRYFRMLLLPIIALATQYIGKADVLRSDVYLLLLLMGICIVSWDVISFGLVSDFDESFMVIFENNSLA